MLTPLLSVLLYTCKLCNKLWDASSSTNTFKLVTKLERFIEQASIADPPVSLLNVGKRAWRRTRPLLMRTRNRTKNITRYGTLQHAATHCNTLQYTVTHCMCVISDAESCATSNCFPSTIVCEIFLLIRCQTIKCILVRVCPNDYWITYRFWLGPVLLASAEPVMSSLVYGGTFAVACACKIRTRKTAVGVGGGETHPPSQGGSNRKNCTARSGGRR